VLVGFDLLRAQFQRLLKILACQIDSSRCLPTATAIAVHGSRNRAKLKAFTEDLGRFGVLVPFQQIHGLLEQSELEGHAPQLLVQAHQMFRVHHCLGQPHGCFLVTIERTQHHGMSGAVPHKIVVQMGCVGGSTQQFTPDFPFATRCLRRLREFIKCKVRGSKHLIAVGKFPPGFVDIRKVFGQLLVNCKGTVEPVGNVAQPACFQKNCSSKIT
jgi:hypothetical protein